MKLKNNAATDGNLEEFGQFGDFEFVINTNAKMESKPPLQGGDSDPLSILSSGKDCGKKYIAFDKTNGKDIFNSFDELSEYNKLIGQLDSQLNSRALENKKIIDTIKSFRIWSPKNDIMEAERS